LALLLLWFHQVNVSLYQAAAAMDASSRWQEAVSENLAEISRPGFKKHDISFSSIVAGKMEKPFESIVKTTNAAGVESQSTVIGEKPFQLPKPRLTTNFEQGPVQSTQLKTDIALIGDGFLEVQDQKGNTFFTRDGELKLLTTGELVTKEGYTTGLQLNDANQLGTLVISKNGTASQAGEQIGQLQLVAFKDPIKLTRISGAYYRANDPNDPGTPVENLTPKDKGYTQVEHGFLEQSNSSSLSEMTNLIRSLRHFEANQQVIRAHDQRLGQAIQALANTQ
jgi:flagellar basal body rod protein FlgG